jgi:Fic family protein
MYTTPIIPSTDSIPLDNEIINKSEKLLVNSAKLVGGQNIHLINAVKDLLRFTNSYYSNMIESEGTHPIDIEKAMKQNFSSDDRKRHLQKLSLIHIDVQKYLEETLDLSEKPYQLTKIKDIHREFYSKEDMKKSLHIEHDDLSVEMIPGELRVGDVKVGNHIAPKFDELNAFFGQFELLYNSSMPLSKTMKLIYALCSHHRLVYIHPFYDGNGRVSRLYLDYLMQFIGIQGYGLWNISRGLARNQSEYRKFLSIADEKNESYNDGTGPLSLKGLQKFLYFMLDVSLDQVDFMSELLRLDSLAPKIDSFVALSQKGLIPDVEALPKDSEKLFQYLLIYGEVNRGKVPDIINSSKPTSIKLINKLIEMDFLISDTPKSPIRIKLNSKFASYIIPGLIPKFA